jgi:hypothetical protein
MQKRYVKQSAPPPPVAENAYGCIGIPIMVRYRYRQPAAYRPQWEGSSFMPTATLAPSHTRTLPTSAATKTAITAPSRSLQQRMDALAKATDIRVRRAKLKQEVKRGERKPLPILFDPPDFVAGMKVHVFLASIPKFGPVKVNRLMTDCHISSSKTIGGMSEGQCRMLISAIQGRA